MKSPLRNIWYAACWSSEVETGATIPVKLLDMDIAVFRTEKGRVAAIYDRCPHRFAPLTMGKVIGDSLQCQYHGLCFGPDGNCTKNPFSDRVPAAAQVSAYPCVDRHGIVWVWPGEAALADETLIPHLPTVANGEGRKVIYGRTPVASHYELGSDNLMDLTHVEFLHGAAFGETTQRDAIKTITEEGDHVIMDWWMPNGVPAPGLDIYFEAGDKPVDIWLNVRWQPPAILTLTIGFTAAGTPRSEGRVLLLHNLLTPESDEKYNYLWAASRDERLDDPQVDELLTAAFKHAFDRDDAPMIAACHERMKGKDFWSLRPVLLENDGGAVRVRRKLAAMMERERAGEAEKSRGHAVART